MASRGRTTFQKRQKELARKEKRERKAERRAQRKSESTDSSQTIFQDAESPVDLEPGSEAPESGSEASEY